VPAHPGGPGQNPEGRKTVVVVVVVMREKLTIFSVQTIYQWNAVFKNVFCYKIKVGIYKKSAKMCEFRKKSRVNAATLQRVGLVLCGTGTAVSVSYKWLSDCMIESRHALTLRSKVKLTGL